MVTVDSVSRIRSKFRVTLSDDSSWWFTAGDLKELGLTEGDPVDPEQLRQFTLLHQYPRGLNLAVAMLARRACSREEIRKKLDANHYHEEVTDLVLYKLEKEGFLDDRAFAEQWLRYRLSGRYGSRRVEQELRFKGVSPEIRSEIMESVSEEDQLSQAVLFIQARLRRDSREEDPRKTRDRILRALLRRGFDWDTARTAWSRCQRGDAD